MMTAWSDARDRIQARVIEDSISPAGIRLTTVEATIHRFVLAELNTHRTMSRNSESSRAVPFRKRLAKVREHPAIPAVFPAEQKGMSGGDEIEARLAARDTWEWAAHAASKHAEFLAEMGVHKSVVNRLLEPFLWHTVVITATEWEGFFEQRCHEAAQPEIRLAAEAIRKAIMLHTPTPLDWGDWHLPYIREEDWQDAAHLASDLDNQVKIIELVKKVSSARCARVSYVTHTGERDIEDDIRLHGDLTIRDGSSPRRQPGGPIHWSPLEHVATPCKDCAPSFTDFVGGVAKYHRPQEVHPGNLRGWFQHRHELDLSPYAKV